MKNISLKIISLSLLFLTSCEQVSNVSVKKTEDLQRQINDLKKELIICQKGEPSPPPSAPPAPPAPPAPSVKQSSPTPLKIETVSIKLKKKQKIQELQSELTLKKEHKHNLVRSKVALRDELRNLEGELKEREQLKALPTNYPIRELEILMGQCDASNKIKNQRTKKIQSIAQEIEALENHLNKNRPGTNYYPSKGEGAVSYEQIPLVISKMQKKKDLLEEEDRRFEVCPASMEIEINRLKETTLLHGEKRYTLLGFIEGTKELSERQEQIRRAIYDAEREIEQENSELKEIEEKIHLAIEATTTKGTSPHQAKQNKDSDYLIELQIKIKERRKKALLHEYLEEFEIES